MAAAICAGVLVYLSSRSVFLALWIRAKTSYIHATLQLSQGMQVVTAVVLRFVTTQFA